MGLYIAKTDTLNQTDYLFADAQQRLIGIAMGDAGIGFQENFLVNIEGMLCIAVSYNQSEIGVVTDRLNVLVNNGGFDHNTLVNYTSPPHIIILAVDDTFSTTSGPAPTFGLTFPPGAQNPFANHVSVYYNTNPCAGNGVWVPKEGGGTTSASPTLLLYHELAHAFQYVMGGVTTDEVQARTDENEMRDELGLDRRDVNDNGGGCNATPPTGDDDDDGKTCIIASLATGSNHSSEVNRLRYMRERILRRTAVGDDFFKNFHYHYYEFSPEVCRLMWREPTLSPLIRKFFVAPLIAGLELFVYYAEYRGCGMLALLRRQRERQEFVEIYNPEFLDDLATCLSFAEHYHQIAIASALAKKGAEFAGIAEVLRYVSAETVKGDFINWALVEVLRIWMASALLLVTQKTDQEVDAAIHTLISDWLPQLPITSVWGEFSRLEIQNELDALEQFIFDRQSKAIFAERLIEKYPRYSDTIRSWAQN